MITYQLGLSIGLCGIIEGRLHVYKIENIKGTI